MTKIVNPILRGFNPDPSIIRVGEDYYIATSTFEWFPGIQIHHSRDLVNWKLIAHPLNRKSQLDMRANPDSGGVWAPCLSYSDGLFYLIFTDVKSSGIFKDTPNYLVTCDKIDGNWSDPIFMNSSGFDPSLFHDDDGRKWFVNQVWDHRQDHNLFGGILLQEYDPKQKKLVGSIKNIFKGTDLGGTEAPHLYKRNGYYYLIVAEGGTEYGHAVTIARSKKIDGTYEVHPNNPILTSRDNIKLPLQKSGHASWVETQNGKHYLAFLVGRPITQGGRCTLGRETALQEFYMGDDDWLHNVNKKNEPDLVINAPGLPESTFEEEPAKDDFDSSNLNINFNTVREPISEKWCSLNEKEGHLRLYGRSALTGFSDQSLIARRAQSFVYEATTKIDFTPDFEPDAFQQMAGLVCYYNLKHWIYLYVSRRNDGKKMVNIMFYDFPNRTEPIGPYGVEIPENVSVELKVKVNKGECQFAFSTDDENFIDIGPELDYSILSDDYIRDQFEGIYTDAFTGSFVGIACQDLTGRKMHADFDYFEYIEYPEKEEGVNEPANTRLVGKNSH